MAMMNSAALEPELTDPTVHKPEAGMYVPLDVVCDTYV